MSKALPFCSPTSRRLKRPNHPSLFLLGFSSKLILWLSSFFSKSFLRCARGGQSRESWQGQGGGHATGEGRGRAGRGHRQSQGAREKVGSTRKTPKFRILAQSPQTGREPPRSLKSARWRLPKFPCGAPFPGGPKGQPLRAA